MRTTYKTDGGAPEQQQVMMGWIGAQQMVGGTLRFGIAENTKHRNWAIFCWLYTSPVFGVAKRESRAGVTQDRGRP